MSRASLLCSGCNVCARRGYTSRLSALEEWERKSGSGRYPCPRRRHASTTLVGKFVRTCRRTLCSARSKPKVIAIAGAHNAGKTTLLTAWYLIAGRGYSPKGGYFAGSYTLEGWENLAHSLRWTEVSGPIFPMHTHTGGRFPGVLHWALRTESDRLLDLLLPDAPGEWFRRWAIDRDAEDAAGARWLAEYADVFIVLADCDALSSPLRGAARNSLELLLDQ